MKIIYLILCSLIALSFEEECEKQDVYTIKVSNDDDIKLFKRLKENKAELGIIIDRPPRNINDSFFFRACKPNFASNMRRFTDFVGGKQEIKDEKFFDEFHDADFHVRLGKFNFDMITQNYLDSNEIDLYIDRAAEYISAINSNISVEIKEEGRSYENRPIKSITISYKGRNNPIVFIDAGIHAREWHSRSLALYVLRQLVNEANKCTYGIIYTTTFVIVPNVNPDGYEHSLHYDKMWRKNRKPVKNQCIGVDGNRNFDVEWSMGERENDPCEAVYKGETPFSECETRAIRNLMKKIKEKCLMYISIHTFGNSILYPYGYTTKEHARKNLLHRVAMAGVIAVKIKTGSEFKADQSGANLYVAAGGSDDYALDVEGIPFAYTFEIGAENLYFAVPRSELKKTVFEGWIAIQAMILEAEKIYTF